MALPYMGFIPVNSAHDIVIYRISFPRKKPLMCLLSEKMVRMTDSVWLKEREPNGFEKVKIRNMCFS